MANTDSFIDEVNEEVRRDRLFGLFRKWAWLAVLLVVIVVGGAAFFEYQRAQTTAAAEAFGDSLISALEAEDPADRVSALEAITPPTPEGAVLLALLAAGEVAEGDDREAAAIRLRATAESPELARRYRKVRCVALHPGTVATDLSAPFRGNVSAEKLFDVGQSVDYLLNVLDGLKDDDNGKFFAWDGQEIPW